MKTLLLLLAVCAPLWVFSQNATPPVAPAEKPAERETLLYAVLDDAGSQGLTLRVNGAMRKG